jgi:arginyl-tRNA synthetase
MIRFRTEIALLLEQSLNIPDFSSAVIADLLEKPQRAEHGDIAFPCFQLAKLQKKAPPLLAKELAETLSKKLGNNFSAAEAAGPYVNFRLSAKAATDILSEVFSQGPNFGKNTSGAGKKILIEYSSPNVAKQLHIGHFRNTILGQSLNNLYSNCGYEVISVNHLGDWGSQFGKVAYAYLQYGDAAELNKAPLEYLTKLYVRVSDEAEKNPEIDREARLLFKKIEDKDPALTALWKRFCDLSIEDL